MAAGDVADHKRIKLEGELACVRNSLASGKIIRQSLSQTLIKKSGDVIELRNINKLQTVELKKRHIQLMALHEENEVMNPEVQKADKDRKVQQEESERTERSLRLQLMQARQESKQSSAECEIVKRIATDNQRVATLQQKIKTTENAAQAAAHAGRKALQVSSEALKASEKALEASGKAAAVAAEAASAKLVDDAKGFSARLERRDEMIAQLKKELTSHGIKVPKARVQLGRPK